MAERVCKELQKGACFAEDLREKAMSAESEDLEYVGFCLRSLAALIDTLFIMLIVSAMLIAFSSATSNMLVSWLLPAAATILFWKYRQATPGKMIVYARVVDARTGEPITFWQGALRYLGYFVSMVPLFLGILWVAFDPRKQGWHDKIAGTVVVRPLSPANRPVRFDG